MNHRSDEKKKHTDLTEESKQVEAIAKQVHAQLKVLGEDPNRDGLLKTPERVARTQLFLTQGYQQDAVQTMRDALFEETYDDIITVKDIEFYSLCEHHMVPFYGRVHIAYIPNGQIVGLSKLPRVVDIYARRLQVQERLTQQIRGAIDEALAPKGCAVLVEATHLCMAMRGVQKNGSFTQTISTSGVLNDTERRKELTQLLFR